MGDPDSVFMDFGCVLGSPGETLSTPDKFVILDVQMACGIRNLTFPKTLLEKLIFSARLSVQKNIVNTMVFIRVHVYRRIDLWVFRGSFLMSFWEVFGVLGVTSRCL